MANDARPSYTSNSNSHYHSCNCDCLAPGMDRSSVVYRLWVVVLVRELASRLLDSYDIRPVVVDRDSVRSELAVPKRPPSKFLRWQLENAKGKVLPSSCGLSIQCQEREGENSLCHDARIRGELKCLLNHLYKCSQES